MSARLLNVYYFLTIKFFILFSFVFRFVQKSLPRKSVLYVGHCYYNPWYLSRGLRRLGWNADVLNWDNDKKSQIFYHGQDFSFDYDSKDFLFSHIEFYIRALLTYDVFHFSNAHGISFGTPIHDWFKEHFGENSEILLLRKLGKKVSYTNNGCLDGVSQTNFAKWGPDSICSICVWKDNPAVCSDDRNMNWGKFRNSVTDYQCLVGGNRIDYNDDPKVHEVPEFCCLDSEIWKPNLAIPDAFKLKSEQKNTIWLYHAVGLKEFRTKENGINIKSTHIYLPLLEKLKSEGYAVELIAPSNVPNKEVRFLQAQADIFCEMLTYGWFGANAREAMMLGKPVVCFIRKDWLESVKQELPDYAAELPIVNATPETVEQVIKDLINHPEKRLEIGRKSREFALKWHSTETAAKKFDVIYTNLINGNLMLRNN